MKLCKRLLSALCAAALLFSFSASAMAANQTEETEQTDPAGQADQTEQNSEPGSSMKTWWPWRT